MRKHLGAMTFRAPKRNSIEFGSLDPIQAPTIECA
jgi:hypothetical protein